MDCGKPCDFHGGWVIYGRLSCSDLQGKGGFRTSAKKMSCFCMGWIMVSIYDWSYFKGNSCVWKDILVNMGHAFFLEAIGA
jgi:hypothetical protein